MDVTVGRLLANLRAELHHVANACARDDVCEHVPRAGSPANTHDAGAVPAPPWRRVGVFEDKIDHAVFRRENRGAGASC